MDVYSWALLGALIALLIGLATGKAWELQAAGGALDRSPQGA